MKLKLLLLLFLFAGILNAQEDTIKTLIISEAHVGSPGRNFLEITNMGTEAVQLSNFEIGRAGDNRYLNSPGGPYLRLPERMLEPGESFFIAEVGDFSGDRARALGLENYTPPPPSEMAEIADLPIHKSNYNWTINPLGISMEFQKYDSISPIQVLDQYFGRNAVYVEQHFSNGDSAVIDQVMGVWDTEVDEVEGALRNRSMNTDAADANNPGSYDVAGFQHAGSFATLIRKYAVKEGNLEFVRGNSEDDSEWIALPQRSGNLNRPQPWTYGNHGNYKLDANTLVPVKDGFEVDFAGKVITVPWGTRKPDDIMLAMEKKPGIYWDYSFSPISADSVTFSCRSGDTLHVVVVGEAAYRASFRIEVSEPTASDNMVIPMMNEISGFNYAAAVFSGTYGWPQVTRHENGIDSITGTGSSVVNRGLPYALRVDTLLEQLEKPVNATWELVPVDGNNSRPDLLNGDKLKVIAEDGSVKEYFIQVSNDVGNNNAFLSTITWPDIPDAELFKFMYGWKGDTIPNFAQNIVNYQIKLPFTVETVPATVAKPANVNANVQTTRAAYLKGTQAERTTSYTVTATDDTTVLIYNVEWQPEQDPNNIQPYSAEPFVSEYVMREYFGNNYLEIVNPGNQPLDLSNYMIVSATTSNPAEAIAFNPENWQQRFRKYVPGYKWVDEATWANRPGYLVPDVAVNPIVKAGDVFCLGEPSTNNWFGNGAPGWSMEDWPGAVGGEHGQSDVNFYLGWGNPWGEAVANDFSPVANLDGGDRQFIFKILNDSVKSGLKAATDPNDFELIEAIGNVEGGSSLFGYPDKYDGHNFTRFYRKPEISTPNDTLQASFGDSPETTEWVRIHRHNSGVGGWPQQWTVTAMMDYGRHYFIPSTEYLSTVTSRVYKVSEGFGDPLPESIRGLVTGVNVSAFLDNITKKNENQTLVVKSAGNGSELAIDDLISLNDTLVVTSANGENTTKYVLEVSEEGLSSDAVITSTRYTISVDVEPKSATAENAVPGSGTVSDIEYGTTLRTLLANVTVPAGASLSVIDKDGAFVPLRRLNFDTLYVDVIVNTNTLLEVVAEDGVSTIVYEITPSTSQNDAFITSDYFNVIQSTRLVEFVPGGISVSSLLSKVAPSVGATLKIVDKSGLERTHGGVRRDDKIVVTSANGSVTNVYHLSMLPTESVPTTTYLAYVLSDVYSVDQVSYVISGPTGATTLSEFYGRITAAMGATAVVVDAEGNEKTGGELNTGDKLKVTSADGKMVVMYTIDLSVSSKLVDSGNILLYPNPTIGKINISGVTPGGRILVFNSTGAAIRDINIQGNLETVSLDDQPAGMYLIVISDKTKMVGRFKVMRR